MNDKIKFASVIEFDMAGRLIVDWTEFEAERRSETFSSIARSFRMGSVPSESTWKVKKTT